MRYFHLSLHTTFWTVAGLVMILGQLTRLYFSSQTVLNYGLAFSLALPLTLVFIITTLFVSITVCVFYTNRHLGLHWGIAMGLVAGGGMSNLLDRLQLGGGVADYWHFGTISSFNLADTAISLGILSAIWILARYYGTKRSF